MAKKKTKAKSKVTKKPTTKAKTGKAAGAKSAGAKKASKGSAKTASKKAPTKKAAPAKAAPKKAAPKKAVSAKAAPKKAAPSKSASPKASAVQTSARPKAKSAFPTAAKHFTPLDNRVLIQRSAIADRTAGGLYIPDMVSDSERPNQGEVIAVGPGHRDKKGRMRPLDVQTGDTVMFDRYAGSEITIENQEFLILREDEIIAIMKS